MHLYRLISLLQSQVIVDHYSLNDQVSVSRDGELINEIQIGALPEAPKGNRITLRAERGRWYFDWISTQDQNTNTWRDELDSLDEWAENDETVQQSTVTVSSSGSNSITLTTRNI